MTLIRNIVIATIILGLGFTLFLQLDDNLKEVYDYSDSTGNDTSVFLSSDLAQNIVTESADMTNDFKQLKASSGFTDVLGALMAVATGALHGIINFIMLPLGFLDMFVTSFGLPKVIYVMGSAILAMAFVFILLSSRLRNEV
jgi:hypothetical protein